MRNSRYFKIWYEMMNSKSKITLMLSLCITPGLSMAADSFYCPQNHAYIKLGMTSNDVLAACGQPLFKRVSSNTVVQQIPVTQLIFTTLNQGSLYGGWTNVYNMWSLPSGSNGTSVRVDVINNKVTGININGSSTNAMSVCGGTHIEIGDNVSAVYSACGSPSVVNNTFINKPVPSSAKPEVWVYQITQYQPQVSLTFVNGALQSID